MTPKDAEGRLADPANTEGHLHRFCPLVPALETCNAGFIIKGEAIKLGNTDKSALASRSL